MKIVLTLPPAERIMEKKDTPTYQHVGLGYLASSLEQNGFDVTVVNAKLDRLGFNQTIRTIIEAKPDVVGITAMTHEINNAGFLAETLKQLLPGISIVIGGVHVSALPVETLIQYSAFDIGIIGEGEYSLIEILKLTYKKNMDFSHLKGVVYRKDKEVLLSAPVQRITNLDELPFPAWGKFPNAKDYIIMASRGCPFSCVFCMRASGLEVRKRSPQNVVEEMNMVCLQRQPRRFLFHDETFTLDKKRVYEICDLIKKSGLNKLINWSATTRVDSVDKNLLLKMKEAGCNHIEIGVESGDPEVLKRIKKNITIEQAQKAVTLIKEIGFHNETGFILGHPYENLESAYKTIYFAAKLNTDNTQLGIMVPYPGTEVARLAYEGKGGYKIISRNWSEYNKQLGNAMELDELSRADLERLQLAGYLKLFVFNKRIFDLLRFIWNYRTEMVSFIKNHFKKEKRKQASRINLFLLLKIIFSKKPNLDHKGDIING